MQRSTIRWVVLAIFDLRNSPTVPLLSSFLTGAMLLAIWGGFVYDVVKMDASGQLFLNCVIATLIGGLLIWALIQWHRRGLQTSGTLQEVGTIPPARVLVTSISAYKEFPNYKETNNLETDTNLGPVIKAIQLHLSRVEKIVLISEFENENVLFGLNKLKDWLQLEKKINPDDLIIAKTVSTANSADDIYHQATQAIQQLNIPASDIVVDVTPGTKALAVGLTLSALVTNARVTYVASDRDMTGEPKAGGTTRPVELLTDLMVLGARKVEEDA